MRRRLRNPREFSERFYYESEENPCPIVSNWHWREYSFAINRDRRAFPLVDFEHLLVQLLVEVISSYYFHVSFPTWKLDRMGQSVRLRIKMSKGYRLVYKIRMKSFDTVQNTRVFEHHQRWTNRRAKRNLKKCAWPRVDYYLVVQRQRFEWVFFGTFFFVREKGRVWLEDFFNWKSWKWRVKEWTC